MLGLDPAYGLIHTNHTKAEYRLKKVSTKKLFSDGIDFCRTNIGLLLFHIQIRPPYSGKNERSSALCRIQEYDIASPRHDGFQVLQRFQAV